MRRLFISTLFDTAGGGWPLPVNASHSGNGYLRYRTDGDDRKFAQYGMRDPNSRLRMRSLPMSTADCELRREMIRTRLAQCAENASDADMIAAAMVTLWLQISARLVPVIGARGVDVLFSRTLYLARKSFSWLGVPADRERDAVSVEDIRARLGRQAASLAAAASCEFLFIFTVLLATLIGDSLTDRLLGPVWAQALPPPERERGL